MTPNVNEIVEQIDHASTANEAIDCPQFDRGDHFAGIVEDVQAFFREYR